MIKKVTISNFKAIRSANIKMTDLTTFIGNNGSGKSSVIEALQTLQTALKDGISNAFNDRWLGIENIRNVNDSKTKGGIFSEPDIIIGIEGTINEIKYKYSVSFNSNTSLYLITSEMLSKNNTEVFRTSILDREGQAELFINNDSEPDIFEAKDFVLRTNDFQDDFVSEIYSYISSWQFLSLEPEKMYFPSKRDFSKKAVQLNSSGDNMADYFSRLIDNPDTLDTIISKMKYVLPDLIDMNRSEIKVQKLIYLYLKESHHEERLSSWLFSSGTLRILAILTVLNSPSPPSVVFIEEIENGLDPRTLNLLVEEMGSFMDYTQFILTSHSPYLLDLLDLSHVVVTERTNGRTIFFRPEDNPRLDKWKKEFSSGKLYLMNKLKNS